MLPFCIEILFSSNRSTLKNDSMVSHVLFYWTLRILNCSASPSDLLTLLTPHSPVVQVFPEAQEAQVVLS